MEAEPRIVRREGEAVHDILHAWGTNGVITRIWLALTPAVGWSQCVVAFDNFDAAFNFSESVATNEAWIKRLVTTFEWPIPSFFAPIKQCVREGKALIFVLIASAQLMELETAAVNANGAITIPARIKGFAPFRCSRTTPGTTQLCGPLRAIPPIPISRQGLIPTRCASNFCN